MGTLEIFFKLFQISVFLTFRFFGEPVSCEAKLDCSSSSGRKYASSPSGSSRGAKRQRYGPIPPCSSALSYPLISHFPLPTRPPLRSPLPRRSHHPLCCPRPHPSMESCPPPHRSSAPCARTVLLMGEIIRCGMRTHRRIWRG